MTKQQPKALYLLATVQLWEFFSHYGNKALLVLYMIQELGFADVEAFTMYAVYGTLFKLGGIFGGMAADRYLGLKKAVILGGWLMAIGHFCMAVDAGFILGLSFIVFGSSFYSTNISALLGLFYSENDPLRERGFTLFYMVMNLGALLSTILCPLLAAAYGWHAGFGLAMIGMVIANMLLMGFGSYLENKGTHSEGRSLLPFVILSCLAFGAFMAVFHYPVVFRPLLPLVTVGIFLFMAGRLWMQSQAREQMLYYFVALIAFIGFYAMLDQTGSSLVLFAERMTDGLLFGIPVPATLLMSINSVVVILAGGIVCRKLEGLGISRLAVGFLICGISFLAFGAYAGMPGESSYGTAVMVVVGISIAELAIGPYVYSFASEVARGKNPGTVMGLVPIAFSCSTLLGGELSKLVAIDAGTSITNMQEIYSTGFSIIGMGALVVTILLFLIKKSMERISLQVE